MMLLWFLCIFIASVLALIFIPRKPEDVPTPHQIIQKKKQLYKLFLKEEKDTKRFFEDYRGLFFS
ncbi:hypothetical protein BST79_gp211 [Only Syngen Nebraska virus 5]|uniref:hypothetical protein n=1 Tax=Only Syngen Nebraska virus 5 TaxID=1917232 RepID=UPI0009019C75|nr:hypothetical protein BST79_gp211 [Only Syngen Nebraska virus 5]APC25724.1 hypothetical protein [Only Syngen Nebraska virus 5]